MNSKISDKDKKDWKNFLSSGEKLPNKDEKLSNKKTFLIKSFDLHGYSLDEANNRTVSYTHLTLPTMDHV